VGDSVIHSRLRAEVKFVLNSTVDGGEYSASRPGRFAPDERSRATHCVGAFVGYYNESDCCRNRKSFDSVETRTLVLQPLSLYHVTLLALFGLFKDYL
jgi:hypothetical protein